MAKAKMVNNEPRLSLAQYQSCACAANQFKEPAEAKRQLRFGLFGEIGGLLAAVKKSHRDFEPADQRTAAEELGDALWYLTTVAVAYEFSLNEVGIHAIEELRKRLHVADGDSAGDLTFNEFDGLMAYCGTKLSGLELPMQLEQLAAHAGQLMTGDTKDLVTQPMLHLLASMFADWVLVGALFKLTTTLIAEENIRKFESRWPPARVHIALFDDGRPSLERLPRKLSMHFIERETSNGEPYVIQQLSGVNIGDRLTDNRTEPDGYRFHDVFHLAYMAHLGWSPVIRALLKLKRKSDAILDQNEDGARAIIIEEGIATWIFNHAQRRENFLNTRSGKLEYGILKQVLDMVDGYEVSKCPLWQWEDAILEGFKVFRALQDAGSGIVHVDMEAHTIGFQALEPEPEQPAAPRKRQVVAGAVVPPPLVKPS